MSADRYPLPLGARLLVRVYDAQLGIFEPPPQQPSVTIFSGPPPPNAFEPRERPFWDRASDPTPARGIVVAAGKGYRRDVPGEWWPMEVIVGDEILFFEQGAARVLLPAQGEVEPEELRLIAENEVLVIVSRVLELSADDG